MYMLGSSHMMKTKARKDRPCNRIANGSSRSFGACQFFFSLFRAMQRATSDFVAGVQGSGHLAAHDCSIMIRWSIMRQLSSLCRSARRRTRFAGSDADF
jgi:hypothetical protein